MEAESSLTILILDVTKASKRLESQRLEIKLAIQRSDPTSVRAY
jgi:hypothetical protein